MRWCWVLAVGAALMAGCRKGAEKARPVDDAALPADAAPIDAAPVDAAYELIERADAGPPDIEVPDIVTDPKAPQGR